MKIYYEDNIPWKMGMNSDRFAEIGGGLWISITRDNYIGCVNLYLDYNGKTMVSHPCKSMSEALEMAPSFLRRNLPSVVKALEGDIKSMKGAAKQLCPRKIGR